MLGDESQVPPVNIPSSANDPPSIGYPIPVRPDGTISIPLTDPIKVEGLTIEEAEQKLVDAYTKERELLTPGEERIILTVIRRKHVEIYVIRQDTLGGGQSQFVPTERGLLGNPATALNTNQQSRGFRIDLPASDADVLSALAQTGGLPGLDAKSELLVYRRGGKTPDNGRFEAEMDMNRLQELAEPEVIPLRRKLGDKVNISEADITLGDRDIVVVAVRTPEYYFTGGLLRNQQIPIPLDVDLTATQAVIRSGGPLLNGGFGGGNLQGDIISNPTSNNPSLLTVLRRGPNNRRIPIRVDLNDALRDPREDILIQNGDTLVLQQTSGEAFARYIMNAFNFSATGRIFKEMMRVLLAALVSRRNSILKRCLT